MTDVPPTEGAGSRASRPGSGTPAGRRGSPTTTHVTTHGTYPHDADPTQRSVVLTRPREGTPDPIETVEALEQVTKRLVEGTGPLAVDAERASGYRYSHRAYLIQLRRAGVGTFLVDPTAFDDLVDLGRALRHTEWVLHAASQDLPCLTETGMRPATLFDTELGARLAGFERVGLAALTERLLGYTLEKHHSAADWSTRPLPSSWLTYAALDVELLVELRYALAIELERQGKLGWAEQEFAALLTAPPAKPRPDPWRRTSGIHRARGARALARVRALWQARDEIARRRDIAPGRILPDAAIMAGAQADPKTPGELTALPGFGGRATKRLANVWLRALAEARALPDAELPTPAVPSDGPPPPHRWAERDPVAAARLTRCRTAVTRLSEEFAVPPENLIAPDTVRRLAWTPPESLSEAVVAEVLAGYGARRWQVGLTAGPLAAALQEE